MTAPDITKTERMLAEIRGLPDERVALDMALADPALPEEDRKRCRWRIAEMERMKR